MKATYILSTSECTSSHSSKWRKEQPFINLTSCVKMLTKYESNLHTEYMQVNAQVHTAASGEKSNHSLITHLVLKS